VTPWQLAAWCIKATASALVVPAMVDANRDTGATCRQLANEIMASPLPGENDLTSMAIMVAVGAIEGAWNPQTIGDCKIPHPANDKKWHACTWDREPQSFGMFQIHLPGATVTREGWSGKWLLAHPQDAAHVAYRLVAQSLAFTSQLAVPLDRNDRLSFYARGNTSPEARRLSRFRMELADRLYREVVP
jgi:hypothetical protein